MQLLSNLTSDSFRASCRWINHEADSSDSVLNIQQVIFDECRGSSGWSSRSERDNSERVQHYLWAVLYVVAQLWCNTNFVQLLKLYLMLLTKLVVPAGATCLLNDEGPTIVSDDSWFGKCAGVHKPILQNHKPNARLLPCPNFWVTRLG